MDRPSSVATFRAERRAVFRLPYVIGAVALAAALVGLVLLIDRLPHSLIQIDALEPSDAIVAENWANPNIDVLERAAELQRQGFGKRVLVPYQMAPQGAGAPPGAKRALRIDLACEAASLDPFTTERIPLGAAELNTLGDARVVSAILHRHKVKRVILVTTLFHSRKSALAYQKFLGPDVKVMSAPVTGQLTAENWWRTSGGRHEVVSNFLKLQYYKAVLL